MTEETRIPTPEGLREQRLKRFRDHPGLRELDRSIVREEEERKEAEYEKARREKAASEIEILKQETHEHFIEAGGTDAEFENT